MVSVIIPVYNTEGFLVECLDSVRNQSYNDFEVICIDDGSLDSSVKIISQYVQNDSRFKLVSKPHSNAGDARNLGVKHSCGEFILFLDSDDYIDKNLLDTIIKCTHGNNSDIYIFNYYLFDNKKKCAILPSSDEVISRQIQTINTNQLEKNLFQFTNIAVWNKLYRSAFIKENELLFMSLPAINDLFFSWYALLLSREITLSSHFGTYYRINVDNNISNNYSEMARCFCLAFNAFNNCIYKQGRWEQLKESILNAENAQLDEFFERAKSNAWKTGTHVNELMKMVSQNFRYYRIKE